MEITDIKIFPSRYPGNIKAEVNAIIDGWLQIYGMRIITGKNGLFVGMPSKKRENTDKWLNILYITDKSKKDELEGIILKAYEAKQKGNANDQTEPAAGSDQSNFDFK